MRSTNLAADLTAPGKAQAACDLDQDTLEAHRQIPVRTNPKLWPTRVTLPPT